VHGKEVFMDPGVKAFREEHECKCCLYYKKECKADKRCVFDYIPTETLDEEIEVFFIT